MGKPKKQIKLDAYTLEKRTAEFLANEAHRQELITGLKIQRAKEFKFLYDLGMSLKDIGNIYGLSREYVRLYIRQLKVWLAETENEQN